jgi:hypothetical protein
VLLPPVVPLPVVPLPGMLLPGMLLPEPVELLPEPVELLPEPLLPLMPLVPAPEVLPVLPLVPGWSPLQRPADEPLGLASVPLVLPLVVPLWLASRCAFAMHSSRSCMLLRFWHICSASGLAPCVASVPEVELDPDVVPVVPDDVSVDPGVVPIEPLVPGAPVLPVVPIVVLLVPVAPDDVPEPGGSDSEPDAPDDVPAVPAPDVVALPEVVPAPDRVPESEAPAGLADPVAPPGADGVVVVPSEVVEPMDGVVRSVG